VHRLRSCPSLYVKLCIMHPLAVGHVRGLRIEYLSTLSRQNQCNVLGTASCLQRHYPIFRLHLAGGMLTAKMYPSRRNHQHYVAAAPHASPPTASEESRRHVHGIPSSYPVQSGNRTTHHQQSGIVFGAPCIVELT
jgi:hypothetical protein